MRATPWLAIQLVAIVVSVAALVHTGVGAMRLGRQIATSARLASSTPIGAFLHARGIDIWGKLFLPKTPDPGQDSIAFVLRASTCQADLAYWDSVSRALDGRRDLKLWAFCDGGACAEVARRIHSANITVLGYGEVESLRRLWRSDRGGLALISDYKGQVEGAVSWRGATAESTALRLMGGR